MLKRFVTYIYQYDRGQRGSNTGFVKTDIRDAGCRMEIQLRGLERFQGKAMVYLIVADHRAIGIPAGELIINQGAGRINLAYARNYLGNSGYSVDQICAVLLSYNGGKLLLSCWTDNIPDGLLMGKFDVFGENVPDPASDETNDSSPAAGTDASQSSDETLPDAAPDAESDIEQKTSTDDSRNLVANSAADISSPDQNSVADLAASAQDQAQGFSSDLAVDTSSQTQNSDVGLTATAQTLHSNTDLVADSLAPNQDSGANLSANTQDQTLDSDADMSAASSSPTITYKKIAITDIRSLPKSNWYLCNNSFLIHGFFNYHYLILKTVESKGKMQRFLGVPGIYEHPERMMALLFGFPTFEPAQADDVPLSGVFGYWMLELS